MAEPSYPVRHIRWILKACKADEPLPPDDPRRYDFTRLRGGAVVVELADTLEQLQSEGQFHQCIFCGHRGSGKSTELLSLKEWADRNGFLTVWIEVDLYFGLAELQFSDLYLLAAEAVDREMHRQGCPLPEEKLKAVVEWFAEKTKEDLQTLRSEIEAKVGAEAGAGLTLLGKLFARFSAGVVAGSEHQIKVRETLRQAPNTLIDMTNRLLSEANAQLAQQDRPNGLLILFDNLDRYRSEIIDALLLKGSTLIRRLACHAVFTMPVDLRCRSDLAYWDEYDAALILPMPALRRPTDAWRRTVAESPFDEPSVDEMLAALRKRIDVEALFDDPGDARLLVKMSGGCMRDLLHLVDRSRQKSRTSLKESPTKLTHAGVRQAINDYRFTVTEGLQEEDYQRLAAVASRRPEALVLDEHALRLLARRRVLLYPGDKSPWMDVHPLIIEDEGFQHAIAVPSTILTD
jgi:hypothetical protein